MRMVREQACQGVLTRMRTLWGGGALEGGDLRLLEDGSERGGALSSDVVASDTAGEQRGGARVVREHSQRVKGRWHKKRTLGRGGAPQPRHAAPLEPFAQLGDALRSESPLTIPVVDTIEHVVVQAAKQGRRGVSMGADTKANAWELA